MPVHQTDMTTFNPQPAAGLSLALALCMLAVVPPPALAQQAAATGEPLVVVNPTLPKGYLRQPYQDQLQARGGITPVKWEVISGSLPTGVTLGEAGVLNGAPTKAGDFSFAVKLTDSGKPAQEKTQPFLMQVVEPLLSDWDRHPKVIGQRIEGSIKVSNQTDDDFDLSTVVLAVSDSGRATAIGIEHFNLKKQTLDFKIPFGDDLPFGTYQVNVNIVAAISATNSVLKQHLTAGPLQVVQTP
jgi:Putative Ig domain